LNSVSRRNAYLTVGVLGLVLSGTYLAGAVQLKMGDLSQPGAGVFPVIVSVILIVASLLTVAEGWQGDRDEQVELPQGADRKRLLLMVALMIGYVVLLPWLGQAITSSLFFLLLLRLLSKMSWLSVVIYALLMSAALYFIFIYLLKIPMPAGFLRAN